MSTYQKKYIEDKEGNKVLPITHVSAVKDDNGNDIGSVMGAFEDEVRGLVDTPHQEYVTVDAYASLPATGSKDTIYRVSNYNGSTSQVDASVYSEYAWDGTQYIFLCVKSQIGEVFDISVYNNNAKYANLAAALNGGANIPQSLQKGGMSVKFVQSSDNKYVQYRLMSDSWSTAVGDWQGVDDGPTPGSKNFVESNGIDNVNVRLNNDKADIVRGNNLFNKDWDIVAKDFHSLYYICKGYRLKPDGTLFQDTNYYTSPFIEVKPNTTYTVRRGSDYSFATAHRCCQYDANFNFIAGTEVESGNTVTTDSSAKYISFSWYATNEDYKNTFKVYEGTSEPENCVYEIPYLTELGVAEINSRVGNNVHYTDNDAINECLALYSDEVTYNNIKSIELQLCYLSGGRYYNRLKIFDVNNAEIINNSNGFDSYNEALAAINNGWLTRTYGSVGSTLFYIFLDKIKATKYLGTIQKGGNITSAINNYASFNNIVRWYRLYYSTRFINHPFADTYVRELYISGNLTGKDIGNVYIIGLTNQISFYIFIDETRYTVYSKTSGVEFPMEPVYINTTVNGVRVQAIVDFTGLAERNMKILAPVMIGAYDIKNSPYIYSLHNSQTVYDTVNSQLSTLNNSLVSNYNNLHNADVSLQDQIDELSESIPSVVIPNDAVDENNLTANVRNKLNALGTAITNNPDGYDLISNNGVIRFANRTANLNYNGLGYVILRPNIINNKNVLTTAMLSSANTIYVIQYDFDLDGGTLEVPANCTLRFNGGRLFNGTITGDATIIDAKPYRVFNNIVLSGTFGNVFELEWVGAVADGVTDCSSAINTAVTSGVKYWHGGGTVYYIASPIRMNYSNVTLTIDGKLKVASGVDGLVVMASNEIIKIRRIYSDTTITEQLNTYGIKMCGNAYNCTIDVCDITNFGNGIGLVPNIAEAVADGTSQNRSGIQYCRFYFQYITCKNGLVFDLTDPSEGYAWINENQFFGGRITTPASYGTGILQIGTVVSTETVKREVGNLSFNTIGFESIYQPININNWQNCSFYDLRMSESIYASKYIVANSCANMKFIIRSRIGADKFTIANASFFMIECYAAILYYKDNSYVRKDKYEEYFG